MLNFSASFLKAFLASRGVMYPLPSSSISLKTLVSSSSLSGAFCASSETAIMASYE